MTRRVHRRAKMHRSPAEGEAVVDLIAQELQARIVSGELAMGAHLSQQIVADEFGVSRTPVREAIRKLEAKGLLELRPHRGAVVKGPTVREVREAYLVRAELEGLAAEIAAPAIKREELARLSEALDTFAESMAYMNESASNDGVVRAAGNKWSCANDLFHEVIQRTADNDLLGRSIRDLHRSVPRSLTWSALSENKRLLAENVWQHQAIKQALEAGDAQRARTLMHSHVMQAGHLVAEWLETRLNITPTALAYSVGRVPRKRGRHQTSRSVAS